MDAGNRTSGESAAARQEAGVWMGAAGAAGAASARKSGHEVHEIGWERIRSQGRSARGSVESCGSVRFVRTR